MEKELPKHRNPEVVALRGRIYRDGAFELRGAYSTRTVWHWPRVTNSEYFVEASTREGETLVREPLIVTPDVVCERAPRYDKLRGYIALQDTAETLTVLHAARPVARIQIPPAPKLALSSAVPTKTSKTGRMERGDAYVLTIDASSHGPDSRLNVVYEWGPRRYQTVYVGPVEKQLKIDLKELPGGMHCRFVVLLTHLLRSVGAATEPFELAPADPSARIVRPLDGSSFARLVPIEYEGQIFDPQSGAPRGSEAFEWFLNGAPLSRRRVGSLEELSPGRWELSLRYLDPASKSEARATVSFTVEQDEGSGGKVHQKPIRRKPQ